MRAIIGGLAALAVATTATPASAFSLRTHLYIAEQVYLDVSDDCRVSVAQVTAAVLDEVCRAVRGNKGAFLAGALGPDAFPDILVGQNYVHPGTKDGMQTADWLEHVLDNATNDEELAFAYGQMIHASGDVFAHSYVNNYAGGIFVLTARWHKLVETRHVLLEKYIDQRLNYSTPLDSLRVPSDLLIRSMVRTPYAAGKFSLTGEELTAFIEAPGSKLAKEAASKLAAAAPASHLAAMWAFLAVSEHAERVAVCQEIGAVYELTDAFLAKLDANLKAAIPKHRLSRYKAARSLNGIKDKDCPTEQLADALLDLQAAEREAAAIAWPDAYTNRHGEWSKGLPSKQRDAIAKSTKEYEAAVNRREQLRAVGVIAPLWAADVKAAISAYIEAGLAAARVMVRNSEPFPPELHLRGSAAFPYKTWADCYSPVFTGMPAASAKLECERRRALQSGMSLGEATLHAGIGPIPQSLVFQYLEFERWLDELEYDLLLNIVGVAIPSADELVRGLTEPVRIGRDMLDESFRKKAGDLLTFQCVSDWIDTDLGLLKARDGLSKGRRENTDCLKAPDGGFARRTGEYFNPADFVPLQHSITLGKLALLDRNEVIALAVRLGGPGAQVSTTVTGTRYSIILDTVRSIDGSYQWQGASMPLPSSRRQLRNVTKESAGYPSPVSPGLTINFDARIKERTGFPYYQTLELRRDVFTRLFPTAFEGEVLRRREFEPDFYPFRPCELDPFRPGYDVDRPELVCRTTTPAK